MEVEVGDDHPAVAQAHHNLALVSRDLGNVSEALRFAELAWGRRSRGDLPVEERAESTFLLAQLL